MAAASYALEHPGEILAILDGLQRERAPLVVTFDDGHALVTSILDVRRDSAALVFDIARDEPVDARLFASRALRFAGQLDHVEIAFATGAAARTSRVDGPAAMADVPLRITRLQRRESFRAALPAEPPIHCTVVDAAGWANVSQAIDLSCGGTAVVVDEAALHEAVLGDPHELILSLPDMGDSGGGPIGLEGNLRSVLPGHGLPAGQVRLGFRFDNVPPRTAARLQRYVQQIEVQQRVLRRRG